MPVGKLLSWKEKTKNVNDMGAGAASGLSSRTNVNQIKQPTPLGKPKQKLNFRINTIKESILTFLLRFNTMCVKAESL